MSIDLEAMKLGVAATCRRLHVNRLDVFGSATTESFGPDSDIDVLVEFDRQVGDLFERYFELKESLEALSGRPVDLVIADVVRNPYFKLAIEQTRQPLYAA